MTDGDPGRVLEDVQRIPAAERRARLVADAVRPREPLSVDDDAPVALRRFAEAWTPIVPVVEGGALAGVLTHAELMRGLQLIELESTQHPPAEPRSGRASGYSRAEQHA